MKDIFVQVFAYLSSLLFFHHFANCWILRLPCKSEAEFNLISKDHVLLNHVIKNVTVSDLDECFEQCKDHDSCKSVNHKETGVNNCLLNSKVKEKAIKSDFENQKNWFYYATQYNTKNIGSYCELYKPCDPRLYCIDTCTCPGYHCFRCDPGYYFNQDMQCVNIDDCASNPCRNGATCKNMINGFECDCPYEYEGILCELVSAKNLALKKPAMLSSQYDQHTVAQNAVDGNLHSSHGTCAITKFRSRGYPWFRVDLQKTLPIRYVALKNRLYSHAWYRPNPFDVRIGMSLEQEGRHNQECVNGGRFTKADQYMKLTCPTVIEGRYVFLFADHSSILEICELEVYAK